MLLKISDIFNYNSCQNSRLCLRLWLNVVSQLSKTLSFSLPYCNLQSWSFCVHKKVLSRVSHHSHADLEHSRSYLYSTFDFHVKTWEFKTSILRCLKCFPGHNSQLTKIDDKIIALGNVETWIDFFCPDRASSPVFLSVNSTSRRSSVAPTCGRRRASGPPSSPLGTVVPGTQLWYSKSLFGSTFTSKRYSSVRLRSEHLLLRQHELRTMESLTFWKPANS